MFGFGKSKTEKTVLKLERTMMAVESAYEKGKYDVAKFAVAEQLRILTWLHQHGAWDEDQVIGYIAKRGLVRSAVDEEYRDEIADKLLVL